MELSFARVWLRQLSGRTIAQWMMPGCGPGMCKAANGVSSFNATCPNEALLLILFLTFFQSLDNLGHRIVVDTLRFFVEVTPAISGGARD